MTTIVAIRHPEGLVMASDRRVSIGPCHYRTTGKLHEGAGVCTGVAGRALYHRWVAAHPPPATSAELGEWVDELRTWVAERSSGEDQESDLDGELLVGFGTGEIWVCGPDGSVVQIDDDFYAIGSGGPEARGALWALSSAADVTPERAAHLAIGAASASDHGTGDGVQLVLVRVVVPPAGALRVVP